MTKDRPLINFAETLAGKYSNREQALENPKHFANINIYYRPLDWSILSGPWFYSEQSYDYAPWKPYKQSLNKLIYFENTFIIENYAFKEPEKIAGAGFNLEFLNSINIKHVYKREGCSMYFKEMENYHYKGKVEPGNKCLIKRNDKITYLISEVEFNEKIWTSLDKGMEASTHIKAWGSEYGELKFKKIDKLGINHLETWSKNKL